jgi:glucose/arabinose dehydrogenase
MKQLRRNVLLVGLLGVAWLHQAVAGPPVVSLEALVPEGLEHPVYVTHAGDGSSRLFVVEQPGRIRIVQQERLLDAPFLDITNRVRHAGEQGLLGLTFHPAYKTNGRYFVNYVRRSDGATVIAEFRVSSNPNMSQTGERILLAVPQPYPNHKGGMVEFGPDGYLYIGLGDGGSAGDPGNRGQNKHELLGKLLRIDVDHGSPYAIPHDNPFAAGGGRREIFAYGLRNPWRFSFDRQTGELWAADVGQNLWEEIDVVNRGGNYGWRVMEGAHCFLPREGCARDGLIPPVAEYGHEKGRCSITGGYVYRGSRLPALRGAYVYGDYCSGEIFALVEGTQHVLLKTGLQIASFGQDQDGELFVVDHGGTIHRLIPPPSPAEGGGTQGGG